MQLHRAISAGVLGVLLGVTAVTAAAQPPSATALNSSYYIDCSASSSGNGTQSNPWNSLTAANDKPGGFGPGDSLLLKRGTTCNGYLNPAGSGQPGAPVTLGAYGSGGRPIIDAPSNWDYAVYLVDQSYWTIQDIEVVGGTRYGVFVTVTSGLSRGITLRNLIVRDVYGGNLNSKNTGLVVISPSHDSTNSANARFDSVLVDGVVASGTNMWSGIIVGTGTNADAWATNEAKRSTNVVVKNSTASNIYGDGIVLFAVNNGLIERSVAHHTGLQPTQTIGTPNGIWTWACNGCTVQYNEAYLNDSPGVDGGGFDVDYFSKNTVIQYNYGHQNSAYCIAIFGAENFTTSNTVVRYNVCANNGTQTVAQRTEIEVATWNGGSIDGLQIYNNTFITNHGVINTQSSSYTGSQARFFRNNIVFSTTANVRPPSAGGGIASSHNLWHYSGGAWSNGETGGVFADPLLVNPGYVGTNPGTNYHLLPGSPAIGMGTTIANNGGSDAYGNPVLRGDAIDIGAHESPYLFSNGGFESRSLAGWSNWPSGGAVVMNPVVTGDAAASQTGSSAGIYRTVTGLAPSSTYTLKAWVRAGAGQSAYVYAKAFGGGEVRSPVVSASSYTEVVVTFTTGPTSTTAEIGLWRDAGFGAGTVYLDDVSLVRS